MAPQSAPTSDSATQSAAASGSAGQPVSLPLRELNKRSGQFGTWIVVIRQAQVDEYEYQWEGQKRNGKTFSCILVSIDDPCEYCIGQMKWTKKDDAKFRSIQKKLADGLSFTMTKVSVINDAKKQYINSPIQVVVNVGGTHFNPLLHSKDSADGCDTYPEPPATIADCSLLTTQQFFDITALVKTVSEVRSVKDNRIAFDADIIEMHRILLLKFGGEDSCWDQEEISAQGI